MGGLVVAQTCSRTKPGYTNFRCQCCCKIMPRSPPPPPTQKPSPPPPSPSPPPPSPPPPSPPSPSPPPPPPSPPPPSPSPPPPSPPPPSPPPPSPSPPPPTPPVNICRAGEAFIPSPISDCALCTRDYCQSQCSATGALLARMGCAPALSLCRCCCKSITLPAESTTAFVSSLLIAAIQ
ncbi:hypothetical protein MKX01_011487 [Papaver californicum]|nr:hypothetical protein MKX01_011487 [Papaver californicum]